MTQRGFGSLAIAGVLALVLGACGGGSSGGSGSATTPTSGAATLPACPLDALQQAKQPVEITYWHTMTRANEDELKKLTAAFNTQQHDGARDVVGRRELPRQLHPAQGGSVDGLVARSVPG